MAILPKKYSDEVEERAVRMVLDHQGNYSLITATSKAVGPRLGIPRNMLRRGVDYFRSGEGDKPATTTTESEEVRALCREVLRLREANEIPRQALVFSVPELDPSRR